MQRPAPAPTPVSGRELLTSLVTFVRTNGCPIPLSCLKSDYLAEAELLRGKKKFSLNPPCLKFLNAKFKEYKLGTSASGSKNLSHRHRHSIPCRHRACGDYPSIRTKSEATAGALLLRQHYLMFLQVEPTHKNKLDGLTEIDLSAFSALTSLEARTYISLCDALTPPRLSYANRRSSVMFFL